MTRWKKLKSHFNYYVTNQRNNPLIYIEVKNTPDSKTENLLKEKGFKFDYNECLYIAPQTNELRLFVAHELDKKFAFDAHFIVGSFAKKFIDSEVENAMKDIGTQVLNVWDGFIDIENDNFFTLRKLKSKSLLASYDTVNGIVTTYHRNKPVDTYKYSFGSFEKFGSCECSSTKKAAPKKKKAPPERQKINKMLEEFEFPF